MQLLTLTATTATLLLAISTQASAQGYERNGGSISLADSDSSATTGTARPDSPSGLSAAVEAARQVVLTWERKNEAIEGYNIYRNNAYHSTVRDTRFTDDKVEPGASYTYSLVAFTSDNRFSLRSSKIDVDTSQVGGTSDAQAADVGDPSKAVVGESQAATGSGGVPAGYSLVFSDEFRGSSLDTSKWDSKYRWGPELIVNNEAQYYVDQLSNPDFGHQPFQFDGEHLTISAIPTPDFLRGSASNQPYLSGAMTTWNKFKMRYGYIEMRARMPGGKGLWPAFWLLHQQNGGTRPEIDIVEYIGDRRTVAYNTYHWFENNANLRSTPTYEAPGPDYSQGFHTYAVRWEPGKLTWYVDGVERNSYSDGSVASEDMYILLNLALGGGWAGNPDGSTPFPAKLVVDYVRAYQR